MTEITAIDHGAVRDIDQISANRDKVMRIEAAIASELPAVELVTVHHFSPGVYARELRIPAGTILTGKIHRTRHLNIISAGRIEVFSPDSGSFTVEAPYVFVSDPGTKRVGYAHTDTVWTTIHPTDETDPEEIERQIIAPDFNDPLLIQSMQALGLPVPTDSPEELCHLPQ